jgi:Ku protein
VEKSYYIAPDSIDKKRKKGKDAASATTIQDKAYSLLVKVLHDAKKVAIGKLVLKGGEKEHLIAIRAYHRGFIMNTFHYMDEIKPVEDIEEISKTKVPEIDKNEMSLGKLLVENLTSKDFDISRYHDEYVKELEELIKAKAKGEVQVVREVTKKPKQTQDLRAALKASLEKPSPAKATKRRY